MKTYLVHLRQREENESDCVMDVLYSAEATVRAKDIKEAVDTALSHANSKKVQYEAVEARELPWGSLYLKG